jgi:hypothetical protein
MIPLLNSGYAYSLCSNLENSSNFEDNSLEMTLKTTTKVKRSVEKSVSLTNTNAQARTKQQRSASKIASQMISIFFKKNKKKLELMTSPLRKNSSFEKKRIQKNPKSNTLNRNLEKFILVPKERVKGEVKVPTSGEEPSQIIKYTEVGEGKEPREIKLIHRFVGKSNNNNPNNSFTYSISPDPHDNGNYRNNEKEFYKKAANIFAINYNYRIGPPKSFEMLFKKRPEHVFTLIKDGSASSGPTVSFGSVRGKKNKQTI